MRLSKAFYHIGKRDLFAMDLHLDLVLVPGNDLLKDLEKIENRGIDLSVVLVGFDRCRG